MKHYIKNEGISMVKNYTIDSLDWHLIDLSEVYEDSKIFMIQNTTLADAPIRVSHNKQHTVTVESGDILYTYEKQIWVKTPVKGATLIVSTAYFFKLFDKEVDEDDDTLTSDGVVDILNQELENYYNKDEVDDIIRNLNADIGNFYTKADADASAERISRNIVRDNLQSYYNKTEIDTKTGELKTSFEGSINDVTTKFDDYYTKTEIDGALKAQNNFSEQDIKNFSQIVFNDSITNFYNKEEIGEMFKNIDLSDYATLVEDNQFKGNNIFENSPTIVTPQLVNGLSNNSLITKSQVEALIESQFKENPEILNPIKFDNLQDNSLITKSDLVSHLGDFSQNITDIPYLNKANIFTDTNTYTITTQNKFEVGDLLKISADVVSFKSQPSITNEKEYAALSDEELTTKANVVKAINVIAPTLMPTIPEVDTSNFAKLDSDNHFQILPTFNANPTDANQAVRKAYVDDAVSTKAPIDASYSKAQMDNMLKGYVQSQDITSFLEYKGEASTYQNLPANAQSGDVYNVTTESGDKVAGFYVFSENGWNLLGASSVKIDMSDIAQLSIENKFEFTPIVKTPNALTATHLITKGEVEDFVSKQDFVKASEVVEFTNEVHFKIPPKDAAGDDYPSKTYVDEKLKKLDDLFVPQNYARLDEDNIFTKTTTYHINPTVTNVVDFSKLKNEQFVVKENLLYDDNGEKISYMEIVERLMNWCPIVSDSPPDTNVPQRVGKVWVNKSFRLNGNVVEEKPSIYVCVSSTNTNSVWWDIHREELING